MQSASAICGTTVATALYDLVVESKINRTHRTHFTAPRLNSVNENNSAPGDGGAASSEETSQELRRQSVFRILMDLQLEKQLGWHSSAERRILGMENPGRWDR